MRRGIFSLNSSAIDDGNDEVIPKSEEQAGNMSGGVKTQHFKGVLL